MKDKKKNPWRFLFLALILLGAWEILGNLAAWALYMTMGQALTGSEAATVGIIGGADGPTAVFVTYAKPGWVRILLPVLLLAAGILGYRKVCRASK